MLRSERFAKGAEPVTRVVAHRNGRYVSTVHTWVTA
jgi:hypothetical protein